MEFREFGKIARLSRDCVITEKIDGTNGQIFIKNIDSFLAEGNELDEFVHVVDGHAFAVGSRTRWINLDKDNMGFARWAYANIKELISGLGEGIHFGEWWGQGIQRGYGMKEKRFSLFNVGRWNPYNVPSCCHVVPVLYSGLFTTWAVQDTVDNLAHVGSYAAPGFMNPEGVVIYHTASGTSFKKTILNDESPKSILNE